MGFSWRTRCPAFRPALEPLEERALLSSAPPTQVPLPAGANPANLTNVNGTLYFAATDPTHGRELWKSDGTAAGTVLVSDIRAGALSSNPTRLTNVNGTLFFVADGVGGVELRKTDGTAAGTVLVKDIRPGALTSNPADLTNVNGTLFFTADDGVHGPALWKSDGTAAGTKMVTSSVLRPAHLTNVNGTLFFLGVPPGSPGGYQIWKSDGTAAGTVLVKDIIPDISAGLVAYKGALYFGGNDGSGEKLWKSDGTATGTVAVKSLSTGGGTFIGSLAVANGKLFFLLSSGIGPYLWESDGTAAGTVPVKTAAGAQVPNPQNLTAVGSTLFFSADGPEGQELWRSDGMPAGTRLVADLYPGMGSPFANSSNPANLTGVNSTLFFTADDGVHGRELWQSDGTTAGTRLVQDLNPGPAASNPQNLTALNGTLFFTADDGTHGTGLYKVTAGSPAPTPSPAPSPFSVGRTFVRLTEGKPFTGAVASLRLQAPLTGPSGLSVTLDWGDGHTSPGTITGDAVAGYSVVGSHTYAVAGSYTLGVTVRDASGHTATAGTLVAVGDAPLTGINSGRIVAAVQGVATGPVTLATFTDAGGALGPAAYSATISWGDGTTSPGTVSVSGGVISVSGSHAYAAVGRYVPLVRLTDQGGSTASASGIVDVARDVTALVKVVPSALTGVPGGVLAGTILVTNVSPSTISGTIRAVLTGLGAHVTLLTADGRTPAGDPYLLFEGVTLAPGQSVGLSAEFANSLGVPIAYQTGVFVEPYPV